MTSPELWPRHTERLLLQPPTATALDDVLTWRSSPQVGRWLLSTTVDPLAYKHAWLSSADDPNDLSFVAILGDRVIGTCTLGISDAMGQPTSGSEPFRRAQGSIGFLLDPTVHGRGYATEMVAAMLGLAFTQAGLHRVTGGCFADNVGSWRVMEKCGMRREQHGVQDSWHADHGWLDGYTYAILRAEWLARPGIDTA